MLGAAPVVVGAVQVQAQEHPAPPLAAVSSASVSGASQGEDSPPGRGTVVGSVFDAAGAMVGGAHIQLTSGAAQQNAVSDEDGHFLLERVPPGPFQVLITLPGFSPFTQGGSLLPGQSLQLAPAVLTLATIDVQVDAIMPEQVALEQLHAEEHQRLVGVLPNFFVSYNWTAPPLTNRQKFTLTNHNVLDPGNLALVGTIAGVQQAANAFPGYGQGAAGYGRRYGADLGNLVVGSYMGGAILPSLFRQDPRYFYKGTGSTRSRALYAISRAVVTRGDNGRNQPNFSGVLGDLSSGAISNLYYPASDRQGATLTIENGLLGVAGDAMNNLVQEFVFNRITTKKTKSASVP